MGEETKNRALAQSFREEIIVNHSQRKAKSKYGIFGEFWLDRRGHKAKRPDLGESIAVQRRFSAADFKSLQNGHEFQNQQGVMRSASFLALKWERQSMKKEANERSPFPSSWHIHELQVKEMGPVRITSWYPKFNGSHFGSNSRVGGL